MKPVLSSRSLADPPLDDSDFTGFAEELGSVLMSRTPLEGEFQGPLVGRRGAAVGGSGTEPRTGEKTGVVTREDHSHKTSSDGC